MFPVLTALQQNNGMSNTDMADLLGISSKAYTRKLGDGKFNLEEMLKLCRFFNQSFDFIFWEGGKTIYE